jgi:hypothetical protein
VPQPVALASEAFETPGVAVARPVFWSAGSALAAHGLVIGSANDLVQRFIRLS